MKKVFLFIMICISIFSEGLPRERIKRSQYFYQEYIPEEARFGEMLERGSRIYDLDGNPLEENRMYYGTIDEKIKYTFDGENKLREIDICNEATGERRREVYHYTQDKISGKSIYRDEKLVDEEMNIFDSDGNLARVENKRGEKVGYIYDKKDRMVMKTDGVVRNYYSYDQSGRVKRDRCEVDDTVIYKREYEYDSAGYVVKIVEYKPEGFRGRPECTRVTLYKYNESGDKTEEKWKENEDEIWCTKRMENKYNDNGDLIEIREYETGEDGIERPVREHRYLHEYY